jgi:hypothetical protein
MRHLLTDSLRLIRSTTPPQKTRSDTEIEIRHHHHACHHFLGGLGCSSSISSSDNCRYRPAGLNHTMRGVPSYAGSP